MTYIVDAPLVLARDQGGHVHHRYQGAVIDWLSDEQAEHFLSLGLVHRSGDTSADDAGSDRPDADATKPTLVAWLAANATKDDGSEFTESELNKLNKPDLWGLINSVEEEA